MRRAVKRVITYLMAAVVLSFGALYAWFVYEIYRSEPTYQVACMEADNALASWTCEQVLTRTTLSPEQIASLNREAGARFIVNGLSDEAQAHALLKAWSSQGVNVNAIDEKNGTGSTALHELVLIGEHPERIDWLVERGAKTDIKNKAGMTALELAKHLNEKNPSAVMADIIRRLQAAG